MIDDIPGLRRILQTSKVIAVVGLSADWFRPSQFAAKYMQEHGYTIIPVRVDMVDVFRKTEDVLPIAEEAIAIGAKVLWQQIGVKNMDAVAKAEAAGLDCIIDRCVKIEHGRLFGGLGWVGVNTRVISAHRPRWTP